MIILIKGLIGSGKTTSAKYLESNFNVYHYNCDVRVKQLYKENEEVIAKVNKEILKNNDKQINVDLLASVVFKDEQKLQELENIVYPYLEKEILNIAKTNKIVLVDGQQVDKLKIKFEYSICLALEKELILKRVQKRDNRSIDEILDILKIQEKYKYECDYLVYNNGTVAELENKLLKVMEEINEKTNW